MLIFSKELIDLSSQFPLGTLHCFQLASNPHGLAYIVVFVAKCAVSGFYKLISLVLQICERHSYFAGAFLRRCHCYRNQMLLISGLVAPVESSGSAAAAAAAAGAGDSKVRSAHAIALLQT